jgi:hypothetical protein
MADRRCRGQLACCWSTSMVKLSLAYGLCLRRGEMSRRASGLVASRIRRSVRKVSKLWWTGSRRPSGARWAEAPIGEHGVVRRRHRRVGRPRSVPPSSARGVVAGLADVDLVAFPAAASVSRCNGIGVAWGDDPGSVRWEPVQFGVPPGHRPPGRRSACPGQSRTPCLCRAGVAGRVRICVNTLESNSAVLAAGCGSADSDNELKSPGGGAACALAGTANAAAITRC